MFWFVLAWYSKFLRMKTRVETDINRNICELPFLPMYFFMYCQTPAICFTSGSRKNLVSSLYKRCSGLKVSALDSESGGLDLSPGWRHCEVFLGKHFALTEPLSTQVHNGQIILMLGGTPAIN